MNLFDNTSFFYPGTADRSFKAHKLVLSICSSTFAQLFGVNGALASQQNPYVYMQVVLL